MLNSTINSPPIYFLIAVKMIHRDGKLKKKIVCNLITCYTAIQVALCFSTMNTTNICCLFYFILCRSICLSLSISNSFPVYVHAVFHFVPPLEIHNLYFGKHNKGDKSYKFMLQVTNFHR